MKQFKFTISGNDYDVEIKNFENGKALLEVNGTCYNVDMHKQENVIKTPILVRGNVKNPKGSHIIHKSMAIGFKVKAPLPGNVMQIMVKVGDTIRKDDHLLTYESMKMENKLLSEKEGVVTSVNVKVGDTVLQDDVLLELDVR